MVVGPERARTQIEPEPIRWHVLAAMLALFILVWLAPPLSTLKQSSSLFPAWLHSAGESFSVAVALLVFAVSWHTYSTDRPANILLLAYGCLAVGLLDFAHMISYRGMPDFITPSSPQKAISFWLAARWFEAFTLLVVAFRSWTPFRNPHARYWLLAGNLTFVALIYALQLTVPERWPVMFIDGKGLTELKVHNEYGIMLVLAAAAIQLFRTARRTRAVDSGALFSMAVIMILVELSLTLYSNVNDVFSLLGHAYKVIAFFFAYRAVFVASVRAPYLQLQQEIAHRQQAEERIEFFAYHDPLTRLPNRLLAQDRFDSMLAQAHRSGGKIAMLFCDVDGFKTVNDSLGHSTGDLLLKALADRLQYAIRTTDTLSRNGGDEFLILLGELTHPEEVVPLLEKAMTSLAAPFEIEGHSLSTSLSVGIAMYPDDGDAFETLLRCADTAMYEAKAQGRNTYCFYDQRMKHGLLENLALRNGLREALELGQFSLRYQPQFDLTSGALIGAEALIRWQHPTLGNIPPGHFIPVAEESGLIIPIGDWVLQTACRQAADWKAGGLSNLIVAVNISAAQFQRGKLETKIAAALAETGLPPQQLEVEITESVLVTDVDQALNVVQQLVALGINLSIDDFGTGYSSLSYLKRFAVHKLKIDQSFVRNLTANPEDAAIVVAIIQMAKSLGLRTIAEGVEDAQTLEQLKASGCDEVQGYHLGYPLTAAEFTARFLPLDARPMHVAVAAS